jgi:hypothetical protein
MRSCSCREPCDPRELVLIHAWFFHAVQGRAGRPSRGLQQRGLAWWLEVSSLLHRDVCEGQGSMESVPRAAWACGSECCMLHPEAPSESCQIDSPAWHDRRCSPSPPSDHAWLLSGVANSSERWLLLRMRCFAADATHNEPCMLPTDPLEPAARPCGRWASSSSQAQSCCNHPCTPCSDAVPQHPLSLVIAQPFLSAAATLAPDAKLCPRPDYTGMKGRKCLTCTQPSCTPYDDCRCSPSC